MDRRQAVINWLALGVVLAGALIVLRLSAGSAPAAQPESSTTGAASTGSATDERPTRVVPTGTSETVSAESEALQPSSTPQVRENSDAVPPTSDFQLRIVHTNDTWGYIGPCG